MEDKKILCCIEKFLAFHSQYISTSEKINVSFNDDEELYNCMKYPEKYKEKIIFTNSKSSSNNDLVNLDVKIKDNISSFKINPAELFAEVLFPFVIDDKNVSLSLLQKKIFFEQGSKVFLYETPSGLEPIITDEKLKNNLLGEIGSGIYNKLKEYEILDNKVIAINFKNGYRDVISAWAGTIKYKYYEVLDLEIFQSETYYSIIKKYPDPILFYIWINNKLIHFGVNSF